MEIDYKKQQQLVEITFFCQGIYNLGENNFKLPISLFRGRISIHEYPFIKICPNVELYLKVYVNNKQLIITLSVKEKSLSEKLTWNPKLTKHFFE